MTNAVKTDTIRNVAGSSYPVPSDHLNLINKKFDKNSRTKLINRKKRNSPKMKHVKETLPRILNRNSDIFASDQRKLQNSLQFFKDSSFSNRVSQPAKEEQAVGFVPSKFIPSKPVSFKPTFKSLEETTKPVAIRDFNSNRMSNPLEFKVNNVEWTGQFPPPPMRQFQQLDHKTIGSTYDTYNFEYNLNNLEPKVTMKELDKLIQETPERYTFWPQEIPTYDLSESSAFPAFINYEQLAHGDSDTKAQYGDYDVAEDRVWIEDEGEIEYVDSLQESQSSTLTHEVPENLFVIPVYEKSVHTKVPNIPEYNKLPV